MRAGRFRVQRYRRHAVAAQKRNSNALALPVDQGDSEPTPLAVRLSDASRSSERRWPQVRASTGLPRPVSAGGGSRSRLLRRRRITDTGDYRVSSSHRLDGLAPTVPALGKNATLTARSQRRKVPPELSAI